ncbi:MAG: peptidylprolyl isomerase [Pyrinomonadaceae bacterium]
MEDNNKDLDLNPVDDKQPEIAETVESNDVDDTPVLADEEIAEEAEAAEEVSEPVSLSDTAKAQAASASAGSGFGSGTKALIVVLMIAALGAGLMVWKTKAAGHSTVAMNKITKEEMEFLLKDASPMMLKRLEEPEVKKQQIENLKQMLALANAAQKEGLTNDEKIKSELEDIRLQLLAVNYDKEINKDKGPMPPFGFIGEDRIKEFWGEGQPEPGAWQNFLDKVGLSGTASSRRREADFKTFFDTKVELAKEQGQLEKDREPTEEEVKQAREYFAKTRIYAEEAEQKMNTLSPDFKRKVELAVKLQQAQYLSRLYATKVLAKKTEVTDDDVQKYVAEHPELATAEGKKAKAQEVLDKVKAGGDFAALAKEFSDDPGSKDKGGLYENVEVGGGFDKSFESAALALEPGTVAPNLVETPFGYHIIKLEKKGETKGADGQMKQNYDVRHILFSTMVKDPDNPMAREMPVKDYVKSKLEGDKEKTVLDEVVAANPVEVAEDFEIPKVSDEQMQQMMQQQMQQQMPTTSPKIDQLPKTNAPKTDAPKTTAPKKK